MYSTVGHFHFTFTHASTSEVAAASALASQSLTPMATSAIPPPSPHQVTVIQHEGKKEETKASVPESTSSWSSMLGLWAWDKNATRTRDAVAQNPVIAQDKTNETTGKP